MRVKVEHPPTGCEFDGGFLGFVGQPRVTIPNDGSLARARID